MHLSLMMRFTKLLLSVLFQINSATNFSTENNSASSLSSYFATQEDKQLMGYVVKRFDSPSLLSCGQQCLRNAWCTSTNFKLFSKKDGEGTCELNRHDFSVTDENINLYDQLGFTFSMLLKGCLLTSCLNGGSCLPDKEKQTFSCSCKLPWIGDRCDVKLPDDNMDWYSFQYNSGCPEDYGEVYGGSCYFIFNFPTPQWRIARMFCRYLRADLPIIKSADENNFIRELIMSKEIEQEWGAWLGLYKKTDDEFYWIDGTPLAGHFSAWLDTEPRSDTERCVHTFTDLQRRGKWNDSVCDLTRADSGKIPVILCQKKL